MGYSNANTGESNGTENGARGYIGFFGGLGFLKLGVPYEGYYN